MGLILYKVLIFLSAASRILSTCEEPTMKAIEEYGKVPVEQEKCYKDLGCISITPGWFHEKWRPVNFLPEDRHVVNTQFVLWKMNNDDITNLQLPPSPEALSSLRMDTVKCVTVIIHDFTSNAYTDWIKKLVKLIFRKSPAHTSVVSVDWSPGAGAPLSQAVANARLVSMEVSVFLRNLRAVSKTNASLTHIIGHGLGAHIAGYVGKCTPNLGRITALDPTGPYFTGMPAFTRLHYTDASFVEALHTDASKGGQGFKIPLAHIDYFPNSGMRQPGCIQNKRCGQIKSIKRCDLRLGQIFPGCSHKRAYKYYIEAISNTACVFVGYKCESYKSFLLGKCVRCGQDVENCATIGLDMPVNRYVSYRPLSKFYLLTSDQTNFCMEVLKFTLSLAYSEKAQKSIKGIFNVTLIHNNQTTSLLLNEKAANRNLVHGRSYTFLVYHKTPPMIQMPIQRAVIGWHHDVDLLCRHTNFGAYIHNFTITKLIGDDHGPHTDFCSNTSDGFKVVKDGLHVEFMHCAV